MYDPERVVGGSLFSGLKEPLQILLPLAVESEVGIAFWRAYLLLRMKEDWSLGCLWPGGGMLRLSR